MTSFVPAEPFCCPPQFGMVLDQGPVCWLVLDWFCSRAWCLSQSSPWSRVGACAIFSSGIIVVVFSSFGPLVSMMSWGLLVALSLSSTLVEHLRILPVLLELFLSVLDEDRHGGGGPVVMLLFPVLFVGSLLLGLRPGACSFGWGRSGGVCSRILGIFFGFDVGLYSCFVGWLSGHVVVAAWLAGVGARLDTCFSWSFAIAVDVVVVLGVDQVKLLTFQSRWRPAVVQWAFLGGNSAILASSVIPGRWLLGFIVTTSLYWSSVVSYVLSVFPVFLRPEMISVP